MIPLPTTPGGWACVLADPAWTYKTRSNTNQSRRPQDHYNTMTIAELCQLPVKDVVAKDAFCFLWATGPHLPWAFEVLDTWGFRYSGIGLSWSKLARGMTPAKLAIKADCCGDDWEAVQSAFHIGMGYTTRKNMEICLLGRRGSPKVLDRGVRELIVAPVREHSRKPDEQYDRIERMCAGPRLEMFSRGSRRGWTHWGDQAGTFDTPAKDPGSGDLSD